MSIGPLAFAIAHLAIILVVLGWAGMSLRQARIEPYRGRRSGARWRRVSEAEVQRRIEDAARRGGDNFNR